MVNTTHTKPELLVRLDEDAIGALSALDHLHNLDEAKLLHEKINKRHPLGIYNVSLARICKKVQKCSKKLEAYLVAAQRVESLAGFKAHQEELIDYIELSLYSAAEHVDDIEAIASCFFDSSNLSAKSPDVKKLKKTIKPIRKTLSAFANALKHNQGRIRLYSIDFSHDGTTVCLHGMFIESWDSGAVGPSPILHGPEGEVISVTSFLWDNVVYIAEMSAALTEFCRSAGVTLTLEPEHQENAPFNEAIRSLTRLPLYCFDETHPFSRTRVLIEAGDSAKKSLISGLYGSLMTPWTKSTEHGFGSYVGSSEGDGVTRKFRMVQPRKIGISHWG